MDEYRCPRCDATISTSCTPSFVGHRCPMTRGNVMVAWVLATPATATVNGIDRELRPMPLKVSA